MDQFTTSFPVFDSTTGQDMSGNITSEIIAFKKNQVCASFDFNWVGAGLGGSIAINVTNDLVAANWIPLPFQIQDGTGTYVTSIAINTDSGSAGVNCSQLGWNYMQIVYTAVSGSGILNGTGNIKEQG